MLDGRGVRGVVFPAEIKFDRRTVGLDYRKSDYEAGRGGSR